jgi:hypothetical protein
VAVLIVDILIASQIGRGGQSGSYGFRPDVPKTWDDAALAKLEIPLAETAATAKHVSADYYYKMPVRPIYKTYPIYAPGHEPHGYLDWMRTSQQKPTGSKPARSSSTRPSSSGSRQVTRSRKSAILPGTATPVCR